MHNENENLTVREFEFRHAALRDELLALFATHTSEHAALKLALDLQAEETKRRLGELNAAHDRADAVRTEYVMISTHQAQHDTMTQQFDSKIIRLETQISTVERKIPSSDEVARLAQGAERLDGRITAVERQQGQWAGRGSGVQISWAVFAAVVMLLAGVAGVIVAIVRS